MIENSWGFNDVVRNIETLKVYYGRLLVSFSLWERQKRIQACRNFKHKIYALHFEEFKRNLIWRYLNDEIEYEDLLELGGLNSGFNNKTNDRNL